MSDEPKDPHPWLSRRPRPHPWKPTAEWEGTPFAIRRIFFHRHWESHCNGLLVCPACGYPTLDDGTQFAYCSLCHWENDFQDDPWADYENGGPNPGTLNEARRNFAVTFSMLSFDDPNVPETTRKRIFTEAAITRQRQLCKAYDQLMELSAPDEIARQWQQIKQIWNSKVP